MRVVASIFLVALLFLNLFGFYAAFVVEQGAIRESVSENIERDGNSSGQLMVLSRSEFEDLDWARTGKEFLLNGRLFDVVSIEPTTNGIKIYVESDLRETSLLTEYISLYKEQSGKEPFNAAAKNILQHFFQDFAPEINCLNSFHCWIAFHFNRSNLSFISSFSEGILSPPPQVILV